MRYDYFRTLHELLQESYHQPVSAWCEAHGLAYVTEVPAMRMATQAHSHVPGGDSAHEKIGRPLEWILDKYTADLRANPKMVSSVAAQYGRERALIECFHSVGWSMTLQDARWMIDRMAALGINFYNFHAFFYTLDGMTQHDAPPSQFDQNPYWQHFRQLGDYTGRISKLMGTGRAIRRIAILDPVTTLWTMLANPLHKYDYSGTDEAGEARLAAYKRYWIELCKTLIQTRRDYDHLDPLILAEQGGVEDGKLLVGQAAYELVLLPPLANLESRAWDVLSRFIAAGGQVIALGMLPHEPIEGDDRVAQELRAAFGLTPDEGTAAAFWDMGRQEYPDRDDAEQKQASGQHGDTAAAGAEESGLSRQQYGAVAAGSGLGSGGSSASAAQPGLHFVPSGAELSEEVRQTLLQLLDEGLPEPVRLQSTARSLLVQQRELAEDVRAVFASHQEDGEVRAELVMDGTVASATGTLVAYALSLENGELTELQLEQRADGSGAFSLQLTFAPYQSQLILIAPGEAGADIRGWAGGPRAELVLPAPGTWEFMAKRDNAIRFDSFAITLSTPEGDALPGGAFRAEAKTIIDQLGDAVAAGVTLPLGFEQPFGTPVRTAIAYPLRAVYEAVFEVDRLPERCELLMDRGAIGGAWRILLNGHALTAADFAPVRFYDNSNQSCDVSGMLVQGENRLAVEVDVSSDWEGVTDALYLTGPFGVAFAAPHRPVMTALPERAELQAGPYPGLPYYAGELVFRRTFDLAEEELPQSERFRLTFADLDPAFHDCAGVALNGHALGVRAWTPYIWEGSCGMLREGANTVEVTLTNTLVGLLEGRYFDKAAHALHPVYEHPLFRPQLGAVQGSGEPSG
ncbi:hypothetical protein [Paenibacillus sp. 1P07SE]|uniref:hypothetical protein n=1 Tax=Paenibacillus sp. 1P07SE TaxID=3132209 RepID=UPI0039A70657